MQHLMTMFDSLTCCKFALFGGMTVKPLADFVSHVTGWSFDEKDFMKAGERIFNLKRMYNVRLGVSRKDDTLHPRYLFHKRGGGTNALPPMERMLSEYYALRGWDEFGVPTKEKLEGVGIRVSNAQARLKPLVGLD